MSPSSSSKSDGDALSSCHDDNDDNNESMDNSDRENVFEGGESLVNMEPSDMIMTSSSSSNKRRMPPPAVPAAVEKKPKRSPVARRRQTIDTPAMELRQMVLRNNANNDIRSKLLNNNQVIIDYNILAFLEGNAVESNAAMEVRMKRFIENLRKNHRAVEYIEYKIENKLYCALDIVFFLPILLQRAETQKQLTEITRRLDDITRQLATADNKLPLHNGDAVSTDGDDDDEEDEANAEEEEESASDRETTPPKTRASGSGGGKREVDQTRNIRLYAIGDGDDFYLMCRKKANFMDGQKNLEKKYGKCRLLKTWSNRHNVKDIGKSLLQRYPEMKWNARTNILTNSPAKPISENDLLSYLVKLIK